MAAIFLPASCQQQLIALGVITPQQAALSYDEMMKVVSATNKMTVYSCFAMAQSEETLKSAQSEYQAVLDQQDLNNLSAQVWQLREKIMSAKWPAAADDQNQLITLMTADIASGLPEVPPTSNIPSTVDPTVIASREATMQAQVDSATALLDKLTQLTASGSTVEWPTAARAQVQFTSWLTAQGIPAADLSTDSRWLTNALEPDSATEAIFKLSDLSKTWDVEKIAKNANDQLWQLTDNSDSPMVVYDTTDDSFYATDGGRWSLSATNADLADWKDYLDPVTGTRRTYVIPDNGALDINKYDYYVYPYDGTKALVIHQEKVAAAPTLMENFGTSKAIDNSFKSIRLWSDGSTVYSISFSKADADFDVDSSEYADFQAQLNAASIDGKPVTAFLGHGLTEYTDYEPVITSVDGARRSSWETYFSGKLETLDKSSSVLQTTLSTESARLTEQLKIYQNCSELLGKCMSLMYDAITGCARKIA